MIENETDPYVCYIIVRSSLNMGAGKVGAQTGHAVGMLYREFIYSPSGKNEVFKKWEAESYRKIVKKADDKEWKKIKECSNYFLVLDSGLTEVPSGSETCMAFWPMKRSQTPKIIHRLQLLK